MRRLILTTGDLDGVGAEVTAKSIRETKLTSKQNVTVVLHPDQEPEFSRIVGSQLPMFDDWEVAAQISEGGAQILLDRRAPALWVEHAAQACVEAKFDALVTGPLSKPGIIKAGLNDLGHTEILRRISKSGELYMSFWGEHFNVVLVTGHIPISKVSKQWTGDRLQHVVELTQNFIRATSPDDKRPLAFVGLNPHAGDKRLIGEEEAELGLRSGTKLQGPLVPDTAFQRDNWKKYAAFLCAYHDQGLIPFKMIHGFDDGVHVTLGLPFLRTSVDHGPATELVGTGRAKHGSMKAALKMALDFTHQHS